VGKFLILLLHAWVRVQADLFPHYFTCEEGFGIETAVASLLGYREKSRLSYTLTRMQREIQTVLAIRRIWGREPKISCSGEVRKLFQLEREGRSKS
jgi:hypothetical protein